MSPIQILPGFFNELSGNSLSILRLDLPDPLSGGNKSFKLKYNLEEMERLGFKKLLTFGGAFSNHIAAVATAGLKKNIATIGIIRGDELHANSNSVLKYATQCGMNLIFVSRDEYRKRNDQEFCKMLISKYGPVYLLPEGGSNLFAVEGCKEILNADTEKYDLIFCPVGTGATLAGIICASKSHQQVIGIAVLNSKEYLEEEVGKLLKHKKISCKWKIEHDFTLGGYGKTSKEEESFISKMALENNLPLDPVYSGKAMFGLKSFLINSNLANQNILFVHTGGYAFSEK